MRSRWWTAGAFVASFLCTAAASAAVTASEYRTSLLEVYGRYQAVFALRDACSTAFPAMKAANEKAFTGWQSRHRRLHDELDQRFALMIRAYSKDDKDYARNFGKYNGAVLRQRDEVKQSLLADRGDLEVRCKGLPEFLAGRDSDLETEFANEWLVLRQWQLPSK
ncbi:MAG TPA: hypothetical protein VHP37_28825 [Burkholderiales bacterium]|nr:hypothetical protein [Burkholderiales bacterium]